MVCQPRCDSLSTIFPEGSDDITRSVSCEQVSHLTRVSLVVMTEKVVNARSIRPDLAVKSLVGQPKRDPGSWHAACFCPSRCPVRVQLWQSRVCGYLESV